MLRLFTTGYSYAELCHYLRIAIYLLEWNYVITHLCDSKCFLATISIDSNEVVVVVALFPTSTWQQVYIYNNCIDGNRNVHMYSVSGYQKKPRLIELAAQKCY